MVMTDGYVRIVLPTTVSFLPSNNRHNGSQQPARLVEGFVKLKSSLARWEAVGSGGGVIYHREMTWGPTDWRAWKGRDAGADTAKCPWGQHLGICFLLPHLPGGAAPSGRLGDCLHLGALVYTLPRPLDPRLERYYATRSNLMETEPCRALLPSQGSSEPITERHGMRLSAPPGSLGAV